MISVVTVEIDGCKNHMQIMLESIFARSKNVSEILIAKTDATEPIDERWTTGNISIRRFSHDLQGKSSWYGHGLGLNAGAEQSTKDYVMFSDPDTFWYTALDEIYLDLIAKHELNYIGVSHHNGCNQGHNYFPYPINSMARRSSLPDADWLKGKLKFRGAMLRRDQLKEDDSGEPADGKFMIPNPIPVLCELYPNQNPMAIFDVGNTLWIWNKERKGRWMSFQTLDCHVYTTPYFKTNFGLKTKLPKKRLLYHLGSGSRNDSPDYDMFIKAYEDSKND